MCESVFGAVQCQYQSGHQGPYHRCVIRNPEFELHISDKSYVEYAWKDKPQVCLASIKVAIEMVDCCLPYDHQGYHRGNINSNIEGDITWRSK